MSTFDLTPSDLWTPVDLRDYFAGQALQAIIMKEGVAHRKNRAQDAYAAADAMLAARESK